MPARRMTRRTLVGWGSAALAAPFLAAPSTPSPVALTGRVIRPGAAAYDQARWDFNTRFSRFPAAIVVCGSVADVQNAVRWARQNGVPLRARSGGHSYEAYSILDDGLVIDLGGLTGVAVDLPGGTAVVGAGARLLDLYRRLADYGVTIPGGTCPGVGIAGLTLGGGIGFLSRQYGLTCDNLIAIDLVDASGDRLRASAQEHPDLFWALRGGGGGNFGIATAFTFRVHPMQDVALGTVTWPWDDVAEVVDAWQRWAPGVDERLTVALAAPSPSLGPVSATALFNGSEAELRTLLDPLVRAGTPSVPAIRTVSYLAATEQLAGAPLVHSSFKNAPAFVAEPLSPAATATFMDHLRASPPGAVNLVGCFPLGGAIAAVAPEATAFVHRRALFDLQYQSYRSDDTGPEADVAWVRAIREAMLPYTAGAYVNYIDADIPDWATAYYGANLARLRRVKARYDPDDVFNGPQSIPL